MAARLRVIPRKSIDLVSTTQTIRTKPLKNSIFESPGRMPAGKGGGAGILPGNPNVIHLHAYASSLLR